MSLCIRKNCITDRKRLNSKKNFLIVIFLIKEQFHHCVMLLSVTHTLLAIDCVLGITTFSLLWKALGWFKWGRFIKTGSKNNWSCGHFRANTVLLHSFASSGIRCPLRFAPPSISSLHSSSGFVCVAAPLTTYLHIHIFTVTPVLHENAAVLWRTTGNDCSPVLLWGGK